MTKPAKTVLGRILEGILKVLKFLLRMVGYVFYGLGAGLGWIGSHIGKLGGAKQTKASHKMSSARSARPIPEAQNPCLVEKVAEEPVVTEAKEPKEVAEIDVPASKSDILAVIQSAPYKVFPKNERRLMESVLTLKESPVREIMIPKDKIVYVDGNELLGPLMLDQLYRSKMLHFPVRNAKGEVIGALHTASLNSLEVKESFRASEILDPGIYYIREDYTMAEALDAFLRNGCYFCLVVNNYGKIVGMVNFDDLTTEIFGKLKIDDFRRDDDPLAVAKRRFPVEIE